MMLIATHCLASVTSCSHASGLGSPRPRGGFPRLARAPGASTSPRRPEARLGGSGASWSTVARVEGYRGDRCPERATTGSDAALIGRSGTGELHRENQILRQDMAVE